MLKVSNWLLMLRVLIGCCSFQFATTASLAADANEGKMLAQRWCSSCHLVGPDQSLAVDRAPTFEALAKMPDFSANKLALLLLKPHLNMPRLELSRTEIANLADYIATLK